MSESLTPYTFRHRMPVQIRFNDIDVLGHLNNSIYLQFMDLGKLDYFRQFMDSGRFNWESLGLVIANININFLAPTFIHEELEVLTSVESIGTKSLMLRQRVASIESGEVKAEARVTMVCYNTKTGATEPISDDWRQKIDNFEAGNQ